MSELRTKSGILVATDYVRVVHGDRGDYVEFTHRQCTDNMDMVPYGHRYYTEWRTVPDNVKVYQQHIPVDYADYRVGCFYVGPKDLADGWQRPEDK